MQAVENIGIKGIRRIKIYKKTKDGGERLIKDIMDPNFLLLSGRSIMRDLIAGDGVSTKFCTKMAFGNNGAPADSSQPAYPASESQAAAMNDVIVKPVTYTKVDENGDPSDYAVTFLGRIDYGEAVGEYVNEAMLRNDENNGICYLTFRSQGIPASTPQIRIDIFWTLKFLVV